MNLKCIEQYRSFDGWQKKYSHYSQALQCEMKFSLYLPENPENKKVPLIWWLSGLTCTDDNFTQKSGFQRLAAQHQVAVVIPDTSPRGATVADDASYDLGQGASFYLDATQEPWNENFKMYTYIVDELSTIVKELVPEFSGNEGIMGHSMGGYGALMIGLKNLQRFKAISAFSPILNPTGVPWGIKAFTNYLGADKKAWQDWDPVQLVKKDNIVPILITQGTADQFYQEQLSEVAFLESAKKHDEYFINYRSLPDYDHSYFFIASLLEEHFAFHVIYAKHLA